MRAKRKRKDSEEESDFLPEVGKVLKSVMYANLRLLTEDIYSLHALVMLI